MVDVVATTEAVGIESAAAAGVAVAVAFDDIAAAVVVVVAAAVACNVGVVGVAAGRVGFAASADDAVVDTVAGTS